MPQQAMQRRPRFNATEYKEDFLDLIKVNPQLAADSAKRLASRTHKAQNQVADADADTRALFGGLLAIAITATVGWWGGSMRAKRDALVADWEVEGAASVGATIADVPAPWDHERGVKNPTTWFYYVPRIIVVPIISGFAAVIAAAVRKKGSDPGIFEKGMTMTAVSTFGLTLAAVTGGISYDRKERQYVTKGANSVANGGAVVQPAA